MRKFFVIWTGQAFSLFGSAMVLAAATILALLPQVAACPSIGPYRPLA
jgi:hypothetical protein